MLNKQQKRWTPDRRRRWRLSLPVCPGVSRPLWRQRLLGKRTLSLLWAETNRRRAALNSVRGPALTCPPAHLCARRVRPRVPQETQSRRKAQEEEWKEEEKLSSSFPRAPEGLGVNMERAGSFLLPAALLLVSLGLTGALADTFRGKWTPGGSPRPPRPGCLSRDRGFWRGSGNKRGRRRRRVNMGVSACWHPSFQLENLLLLLLVSS